MVRRKKRNRGPSTAQTRRLAEQYQRRRDELMEQTLLGMDDGTPDAALNEELNFDKFMGLLEEEAEEVDRRTQLLEQEEPAAMQTQKRFRERIAALKINWG